MNDIILWIAAIIFIVLIAICVYLLKKPDQKDDKWGVPKRRDDDAKNN